MKKLFKIFLVMSLLNAQYSFVKAQNLVPNPSFEDTVGCPIGPDELYKCNGWQSYGYSPDFMSACSLGSMGVPNNWAGFQNAASGSSYVGISTFSDQFINYREFIGSELSAPLIIGQKYFISWKSSLSLNTSIQTNCATNKIGARFSTIGFNSTNPPSINNFSHILESSVIMDSSGWLTTFGSFVADSSYSRIILGNFFDDSNTDTLIMDGGINCKNAYYFIDDVCVSTDSLFANNYNYNAIIENTNLSSIVLDQNVPNPFAEQTTITYTLTDGVNKAQMLFYNIEGKLIQSIDLSNASGQGQINVFANDLSTGVYTYSLVVDGEIKGTKRMVKE